MKYISQKDREILREIVRADFKVRYQGSVLGYFWSILKPLLMFAVLYVLFTYVAPIGRGVEHYGVALLMGIVFWNFFSETTSTGATSIVDNGDLIRKIRIPRYLVIVARSASALINLGLSLVVVFIFAFINGVMPVWPWFLIVIIIAELYIFALGVAFILATTYVKFRDIAYIWEFILQAGFYASAVIVPLQVVPPQIREWFFLNPLVQIIQDGRALLIPSHGNITLWNTIDNRLLRVAPFLVIIFAVVLGIVLFRSRSKYFAEDV